MIDVLGIERSDLRYKENILGSFQRKLELRNKKKLIIEKDKDVSLKKNRPTKRILKTLFTLNTQKSNKQTSHQAIAHQICSEKSKDSHFPITD